VYVFTGGTGVWTQGITLAKQTLYLLWLFWRWGSHELFVPAGLKPQSSQFQPPKKLGLQVQAIRHLANSHLKSVVFDKQDKTFFLVLDYFTGGIYKT
jgi:hypothetical protein